MQPPAALIKRGVTALPCIGDGRQSGTSGSPSILNASPEAAAGGGLALLKTGDRVRIDLRRRAANILISEAELAQRRAELTRRGGYAYPKSQTPWQQIQRDMVAQFDEGMVLKPAIELPAPRSDHVAAARQSLTVAHWSARSRVGRGNGWPSLARARSPTNRSARRSTRGRPSDRNG